MQLAVPERALRGISSMIRCSMLKDQPICPLRTVPRCRASIATRSTSKTPQILDQSLLVEEESVPGYKSEHYYPVRIAEVFKDRYKVVGKLGWGSASTVWLCGDAHEDDAYVALKVYINSSKAFRELEIYGQINRTESEEPGRDNIRKLLDSFEIHGPHGTHPCLVHEARGNSLHDLRSICDDRCFSPDLLRQTLRPILEGLRFLHEEAHVIHTDLQPSNLLLGVHKRSLLEEIEQDEISDPTPRKELPNRTIYVSRAMGIAHNQPANCDFSEARFGDKPHRSLIMPDVYRAPEVILDVPWSYPLDVWGFAMVLWDLFEPLHLFRARSEDGKYCEETHLAQMVSIMGPPPLDLLAQSERGSKFWDANGG